MSQLNFYVPDDIEEQIRSAAQREGKSISLYISDIIKSKLPSKSWSKEFFSGVVGKWEGEFPTIERPLPQEREEL